MKKLKLPNVTLLGIDCVNIERLIKAINISEEEIEFGAVKLLTSLDTDDKRKIEIPNIKSVEEYSLFCIRDLHKYVDTDFVLIIQHDGFILNPKSWTDEFLKYDYIGAPWFISEWSTKSFKIPKGKIGEKVVGNGGFCFRSKKLLEISNKLFELGKIQKVHPEDVSICVLYKNEFEKENIKFAPTELARKFSIEDEEETYNEQFGFHGFWCKDLNKWFKNNPKYSFLLKNIKEE